MNSHKLTLTQSKEFVRAISLNPSTHICLPQFTPFNDTLSVPRTCTRQLCCSLVRPRRLRNASHARELFPRPLPERPCRHMEKHSHSHYSQQHDAMSRPLQRQQHKQRQRLRNEPFPVQHSIAKTDHEMYNLYNPFDSLRWITASLA